MRKALLTSTAAIAIGMFAFGSAMADPHHGSTSVLSHNNVPVQVTGGGTSNANANQGSNANSGTQGSYNRLGSDNSSSLTFTATLKNFDNGSNDGGNTVSEDGMLNIGSGTLRKTVTFTNVDINLATSQAGGHMGGAVYNGGGYGEGPDDYKGGGSGVGFGATVSGSTGVITQNVNVQGIQQANTAVTALGINNSTPAIGGDR
jgi:hypothetical protein